MLNSFIYSRLYEWYEREHRSLPWRETEDTYCIWLSEIILQQTRVVQGIEYYRRFVSRWPRVEDLAAADEAEVLREWQGLGYYSRARNLHKAAKMIVEQGWTPFPTRFEDIRSLPGIGDYTAGAIASFAYDQPYPAMDGNVYRIVARLLDIDEAFDTSAGKKLFHEQIATLMDREHPRLFNSALMEFGALHCTPVLGDHCSDCPLQDCCAAHAHGTAELLPVRKPRAKVRDRWFDYHVYLKNTEYRVQNTEYRVQNTDLITLIQRRENPKDIWYHLYEFPCEELSCQPSDISHQQSAVSYEFTHILSHQKLHARFIVHAVEELPVIPGTFCVSWQELERYAFSRLTIRFLSSFGQRMTRNRPTSLY